VRRQDDPDHPILFSEEQLTDYRTLLMIAAMSRTLLAAALAGTFALAGVAQAQNPVLIAKVGLHNSYKIALRTPDGKLVRSIPAGTYSIVVHDYSRFHNFALGSQTENKRLFTTGIRWVGTRTYTLTLGPGNYAYACSAHFRTMNGTFVVTGG
jgi:hypothetical protein